MHLPAAESIMDDGGCTKETHRIDQLVLHGQNPADPSQALGDADLVTILLKNAQALQEEFTGALDIIPLPREFSQQCLSLSDTPGVVDPPGNGERILQQLGSPRKVTGE